MTLDSNFETAEQVLEKRQTLFRISTGSSELDEILGGGVQEGAITEFYGEFRTGKTQICLQLALHTTLPKDKGGLGGKVIYLDTEGAFHPERLVQMCERYEIDHTKVLEKIYLGKAPTSEDQMNLIHEATEMVENEQVRLIIIDSLTSNFRSEYIGRERLLERQQKLNVHLHDLLKIVSTYEVAVVITNQVVANMIEIFGEDKIIAAGGHIVAHATTHRIELRRKKENAMDEGKKILIGRLIDSPSLPEKEGFYRITRMGIENLQG